MNKILSKFTILACVAVFFAAAPSAEAASCCKPKCKPLKQLVCKLKCKIKKAKAKKAKKKCCCR